MIKRVPKERQRRQALGNAPDLIKSASEGTENSDTTTQTTHEHTKPHKGQEQDRARSKVGLTKSGVGKELLSADVFAHYANKQDDA